MHDSSNLQVGVWCRPGPPVAVECAAKDLGWDYPRAGRVCAIGRITTPRYGRIVRLRCKITNRFAVQTSKKRGLWCTLVKGVIIAPESRRGNVVPREARFWTAANID